MKSLIKPNNKIDAIRISEDCCAKNRKANMSYRDNLKVQIKELEDRISKSKNDSEEHVSYLEKLLNTLKLKEFSEDMMEEDNKILLKG